MQPDTHKQLLELTQSYKMPASAAELLKQNKPLILAGVTAAGKDTILKQIEQSSEWRHSVTHTTRAPRADEQDGVNYWFVDEQQMLELLQSEKMIEAQAIHGETIYSTSIAAYQSVIDQNHNPLLRIDIQGILELANQIPDLQAMFILPPSFEVWMERLEKRGHMSHVEKIKRLRSAQMELREALKSRHFIFILNRDYQMTAKEILGGSSDGLTQHRNREVAQQLIDHIAHF
jgi:guanylate kinase